MSCTHVQWCLDHMLCSIELGLLTGLLSPVSCPLFLGCPGRHLSLRLLVTTSQFCIKGNSFLRRWVDKCVYVAIVVCKCWHCGVCTVHMHPFIVDSGFLPIPSQVTRHMMMMHTHTHICTWRSIPNTPRILLIMIDTENPIIYHVQSYNNMYVHNFM